MGRRRSIRGGGRSVVKTAHQLDRQAVLTRLSVMPRMYEDIWHGLQRDVQARTGLLPMVEKSLFSRPIDEVSYTQAACWMSSATMCGINSWHQWDKFKDVPGGRACSQTHLRVSAITSLD